MRFTVPEAAFAAQISEKRLRQLLERHAGGALEADETDILRPGTGRDAQLGRERVVQIAVAARLVDLGVGVADALRAAFRFVVGDEARKPAEAFRTGETWLLASPNGLSRLVWIAGAGAGEHRDRFASLGEAVRDLAAIAREAGAAEPVAVATLDLSRMAEQTERAMESIRRTVRPRNTRLRGTST